MCFKTIPLVSRPRSNITHRRQRNPANLRPISSSSTTPLSFSMALWNCQSVVNKADLISAFSLQSTLRHLGLDWYRICPEDSATPAALSNNLSFSPPHVRWSMWGTGLLFSNNWKYSTYSPQCNYNSFESHVITVIAPIKLPDCGNLPSSWPNYSPLPRGAGRVAVLFHGGWHSNLSFWRFQHSSKKKMPYATDFHSISNALPRLALTNQATNWLNLHTRLYCW